MRPHRTPTIDDPTNDYDPGQKRDGHGRWTDGMPDMISSEVLGITGGSLTISANRDNPGGFALSDGDRTITVPAKFTQFATNIGRLKSIKVGESDTYAHPVALEDGTVEGWFGITRTAEDRWEMKVAAPGDTYDTLTDRPGMEITSTDVAALKTAMLRQSSARRVDTQGGPADFYPAGNGMGVRVKTSSGEPLEMEFTEPEWARVRRAIDVVYEGVDEAAVPPPGAGPDWEPPDVTEVTVDTGRGPLSVASVDGVLSIAPATSDAWHITWPKTMPDGGDHPIWDAFGEVEDVNDIDIHVYNLAAAGMRARTAVPDGTRAVVAQAMSPAEPGPMTGAMIALVPTTADAARLAVDGGEPAGELHTTLVYLGKAANIPDDVRTRIVDAVTAAVEDAIRPDHDLPVEADAFAVSVFNPGTGDACIVLGLSGQDLAGIRTIVADTVNDVEGLDLPEQHDTFVPHVTLVYTGNAERVAEFTDRVGPVVFDRIRVAFAGEAVDIPLIAPSNPTALPGEPALGPSNTATGQEPATDTDQLLPIRVFTDPTNDGEDPVGARTEARKDRTRMRVQAKRKWFRIENKSSGTDIYLYGEIGYFGVTAADFCEELQRVKASAINLHINSPGGQVYEGVAIYNALREHPATINVTVDGIAASAASFIACAGDHITIMRHAQMMIHDAWSDAYGNADQLRKYADNLERTSASIADIYSRRAGGDAATWRALMKAETWFNADEAVQFGLADAIGGDVLAPAAPVKSAWDLSVFAFAGRDRAPAPVLTPVMAAVGGPEPDDSDVLAGAAEAAPAEDGEGAGPEPGADLADEAADANAPDAEQAAEPAPPADTAPNAAQPVAWAAPAWTTTPADPWRSLVSGLTTPEPSTPDDPTAQEATQ